MSFDSNPGGQAVDYELQQFVQVEESKARFQGMAKQFTNICWEKCIDKPSSKFDSRTESCLKNCVERYLDTTNFIVNRFQKLSGTQ